MPKLILKTVDDLAALDTAIEGALEVLADDGESASPKAEDYQGVIDYLRAAAERIGAYPMTIETELSGEETTLLAETVADQLGWDDEFTGEWIADAS